MPYITPEHDVEIKQGRSLIRFKGGQTTMVTFTQLDAYNTHMAAKKAPVVEAPTVTLHDDDPEIAELLAETAKPVVTDADDRQALIRDLVFEVHESGEKGALTRSGEVKMAVFRDRLGFSVTDDERDAAADSLRKEGLI